VIAKKEHAQCMFAALLYVSLQKTTDYFMIAKKA
jgi:hypothetical protein